MITINVTRAKHAGTVTINLRKQCGMRSRYTQFRPLIALRTDLLHITTELWEIPVLRMAH